MSEIILNSTVVLLQILIAFGLINVWLIRSNKKTKYRGGSAKNMKEEFSTYGLPIWFMYTVGSFKIIIATVMIVTLFVPDLMNMLGVPAIVLLIGLMFGAISMHIKVKDSLVKTLPAIGMFGMAVLLLYLVIFIK